MFGGFPITARLDEDIDHITVLIHRTPEVLTFALDRDEDLVQDVSPRRPCRRLSPRWLAYQSNESGQYEIYVVGYPNAEARQQISTDGGISPLWDPDGRALYYRNGDKLMAVELDTTAGFTAARPRILFEAEFAFANRLRNYDITPDGERFLMIQLPPEAAYGQLEVVVHWFEELRRLVPTE